jgi:hypothetical protein
MDTASEASAIAVGKIGQLRLNLNSRAEHGIETGGNASASR